MRRILLYITFLGSVLFLLLLLLFFNEVAGKVSSEEICSPDGRKCVEILYVNDGYSFDAVATAYILWRRPSFIKRIQYEFAFDKANLPDDYIYFDAGVFRELTWKDNSNIDIDYYRGSGRYIVGDIPEGISVTFNK